MRAPLAITLDLDDTVWPIAPVIARAEAALDGWLREHAPATARRWPADAMRALLAQDPPDALRAVIERRLRETTPDVVE